jgi:hypothetical protein
MKNSNDIIENRTRDLLTCSAVPQPTAPPRAHPSKLQQLSKSSNISKVDYKYTVNVTLTAGAVLRSCFLFNIIPEPLTCKQKTNCITKRYVLRINTNTFRFEILTKLLVRVSGYRYRGPGFDSRRYQIF